MAFVYGLSVAVAPQAWKTHGKRNEHKKSNQSHTDNGGPTTTKEKVYFPYVEERKNTFPCLERVSLFFLSSYTFLIFPKWFSIPFRIHWSENPSALFLSRVPFITPCVFPSPWPPGWEKKKLLCVSIPLLNHILFSRNNTGSRVFRATQCVAWSSTVLYWWNLNLTISNGLSFWDHYYDKSLFCRLFYDFHAHCPNIPPEI